MKRIKKINEDWSSDYTYDFTDHGFEIEENGNLLTGKYKGQFIHSDISSWFEEMLAKLSDEQKVVRSKTYFNELTGNASFEVEIKPTLGEHSIEVEMDGVKNKLYLKEISSITWNPNNEQGGIYLHVNLENGKGSMLWVGIENRGRRNNKKIVFHLGNRTRGISIQKDDIIKLIELIYSDKIKFKWYNLDSYYKNLPKDSGFKERIDNIKKTILNIIS